MEELGVVWDDGTKVVSGMLRGILKACTPVERKESKVFLDMMQMARPSMGEGRKV